MDSSVWAPWLPANGTYTNVPPGATRDFKNKHVVRHPMGGKVIRLEKTEATSRAGTGTSSAAPTSRSTRPKSDYLVIGTDHVPVQQQRSGPVGRQR